MRVRGRPVDQGRLIPDCVIGKRPRVRVANVVFSLCIDGHAGGLGPLAHVW